MAKQAYLLAIPLACWVFLSSSVFSAEEIQADGGVSKRAVEPGQPVLGCEPIEARPNLLPNASFEMVGQDGLEHWHWNPNTADATMIVDDTVAHSGKRSVRIANSTPFAPHFYGLLSLSNTVTVRPNTTYTFSCYVKGERIGIAWVGGGRGWHARAHFPRTTQGQWMRVELPFTTEADDATIPAMVVTESRTEGFWVDDVQLVEGPQAQPFIDEQEADSPALSIKLPTASTVRHGGNVIHPDWNTTEFPRGQYVFRTRDLWAEGCLYLPRDLAEATLTARLATRDGNTLTSKSRHGRFAAGMYLLSMGSWIADCPGGDVRLDVSLDGKTAGDGKPVRLKADLERRLITTAGTEAVLERVEALRDELRVHVESLRDAGRDSAYPLVTLTILDNFVGYAREDIRRDELARAHDAAVQMEAMAREALGREFLPPVPRYVTSPERPSFRIEGPTQLGTVRWPDGRTEADRPLQLVGVGHFATVMRDIDKLTGYGLNIVQVEFGPRSVLPGEDRIDTTVIEQYLGFFDRAAQAGVAVNLLISPHYFPDWAYAKWPHLRDAGGGFMNVDVHAPEARSVYEKYLRAVIPRIRHHPALHSICLSNEPVFTEAQKSRFVVDKWRRWLGERHGTIAELNRRWSSQHADFESIAVPPTEFQPSPTVYDFICFNQEAFAEFHSWMAAIIRELAPEIPLHAKIMIGANFMRHPHGPWSISPELFTALSDFNGNDAWKYYLRRGPWASAWQDENMGYDFQQSMAGKPIFNSENHLITDRVFDLVPPSHISNVLWQGAVHGQSATTAWVWERTYSHTHDFSGSIMHRPRCVEAMGRTGLDLMRLSEEITSFQKAPIQIALLWSPASLVAGQEYLNLLRQIYEALNFHGVRLGFVTERQLATCAETGILPAPLDGVKLVVATGVTRSPRSTTEALTRYRARGGEVFLIGPCFSHDEYGREHEIDDRLPQPLAPPADSEEGFAVLGGEITALGIESPVQLRRADGKAAWGVEHLAVRHDGRLLVNLCNYLNQPQSLSVLANGKAVGGTDLRTGQALGKALHLPPLEPVLLEVREEK